MIADIILLGLLFLLASVLGYAILPDVGCVATCNCDECNYEIVSAP